MAVPHIRPAARAARTPSFTSFIGYFLQVGAFDGTIMMS